MPNRLARATSPYLLQHQDNPVDWYEWGDEANAAARARDVPILLSVGYSACHWCHVMAHESFEDPETAAFMNGHFVNVKVDREERPDIDRIYMDAVQATTGRGGWPMTVFLTPDGRPFFAGTYYPKVPSHGMPSFRDVLEGVTAAWTDRRDDLDGEADRISAAIRVTAPAATELPDLEFLDRAVADLAGTFDPEWGGFGGAPKFPQPSTLELLMRYAALFPERAGAGDALAMIETTLERMARGGIYDQIGGGFARYSVDRFWLIPHFEKMLYDNALLARTYLRVAQLTGREDFTRIAIETLDYLVEDMADPIGGLHSAEDADTQGIEGGYSVWTWDELGDVLGSDRELAAQIYGASPPGNYEGANVLHLPGTVAGTEPPSGLSDGDLAAAKTGIDRLLLERRETRVKPGRDDKIVTAWNGLALRTLAEAGAVLDVARYRDAAVRIATFLTEVADTDGTLHRSWRRGRLGGAGFSDDYAATALGLYTLYETTGDQRWFDRAEDITRRMIELFADGADGFFATVADSGLIARPKNLFDSPTPSDNALAAEALLMHAALTGAGESMRLLEGAVRAASASAERHPAFAGYSLAVWATVLAGIKEVAIVGSEPGAGSLSDVVWQQFRPEVALAVGDGSPTSVPLLEGRDRGNEARAYVCRDFVCALPVETPEALRVQLDERI
jgi:uncharacterized protein YyaL (SSP411 family)